MVEDPFNPLNPLWMGFLWLIEAISEKTPDIVNQTTKYSWTIISILFLYRGIVFNRTKRQVEQRRIESGTNGFRKIRSTMWLSLSKDFIHQAIVAALVGLIAVWTPDPVRVQLTFLQVATSSALIFIIWKAYRMVQRVDVADKETIDYARIHHPEIVHELAEEEEIA